jgi:hypothetical protein
MQTKHAIILAVAIVLAGLVPMLIVLSLIFAVHVDPKPTCVYNVGPTGTSGNC